MRTVYIMQGVPGSGKSTWIERNINALSVSADHFFYQPNWWAWDRQYIFDPSKLGIAHASCMRKFIRALEDTEDDIVVDNTSPRVSDMSPYYSVAKAFDADVVIVRVTCDPKLAARRNVHGVPMHSVERIQAAMEDPPKFWDCKFQTVGSGGEER